MPNCSLNLLAGLGYRFSSLRHYDVGKLVLVSLENVLESFELQVTVGQVVHREALIEHETLAAPVNALLDVDVFVPAECFEQFVVFGVDRVNSLPCGLRSSHLSN